MPEKYLTEKLQCRVQCAVYFGAVNETEHDRTCQQVCVANNMVMKTNVFFFNDKLRITFACSHM